MLVVIISFSSFVIHHEVLGVHEVESAGGACPSRPSLVRYLNPLPKNGAESPEIN